MEQQNKLQSSFVYLALSVKNVIDIVLGIILLFILLPLFMLIGIIIKIDTRGSIFFIQERVGINGKPFFVYKFRTMVDDAVNIGAGLNIIDNDPRITFSGKTLRNTSLDELPQLINIVKGDMSFIGPRPTLQYQVDNYTPHQRKRLNMKPGITGWAQINGRNNIPWEERIELDVWYVENWSLWLDIKILLKTPKAILSKEDVYSNTGVSYDFKGTENNKKE